MGSVDDPIDVEVVDISLTLATKLMDQGALNLPMHVPPLMSMASTLEESSTAFNDSPEGRACYPLSRRKVKSTTRKDRRRPVAASSGSDSELAGATGTNSEGALMGVPTTGLDGSDNASPLGGCSGTGSSHERPPIPPLFEGFGARGSSGAACGVPAPKEVAEESAAEAKQQALAAEEKIATIKRDLDTTRKEVANAEERASTAASQLADSKIKSFALEPELASIRGRLTAMEEKDKASATKIIDLQADVLSKEAQILLLEGRVTLVKSLLEWQTAEGRTGSIIVSTKSRCTRSPFLGKRLCQPRITKKWFQDGVIVEPEDDDDPDLSFLISDVKFSSGE
ncbi:hypothetical protein L6164_023543 [Bauhinia variegata]|uniref:Uncharacterized protein n=1 Tax=Bauhinia variegata TaxID=167791 RepID=A0ACB9MKG4_BAUVA|nr:hypothetical protein L6164_023543 [Bauhinia variegata]